MACCSELLPPPKDYPLRACSGLFPSGSTIAAVHWYSRSFLAATGCVGRRSRHPARDRSSALHGSSSLPPDPSQRTSELLGQREHCARNGVAYCFSTVPGEGWPVLLTRCRSMSLHRRQVEEHREACRPFNKGADRGAVEADDQIPFPVSQHRAILDLGRTLADERSRRLQTICPAHACAPAAPATPGQSAGTASTRASTRPGLERRAPGRSPRG